MLTGLEGDQIRIPIVPSSMAWLHCKGEFSGCLIPRLVRVPISNRCSFFDASRSNAVTVNPSQLPERSPPLACLARLGPLVSRD